jgi:septal ring factor EnvC (AmiA/AmiB activator)
VKLRRKAWLAVGMLALVGAVAAEDLARRRLARQLVQAAQASARLEEELGRALGRYEQAAGELAQTRTRADALASELERRSKHLDEAMARLAEQSTSMRELERRLSATRAQFEQLQGELAVVLGEAKARALIQSDAAVALDRILVASEGSRVMEGRVISVHPEWSFVVADLGWDSVKIGDTVSILRDDEVQAKARVERVQEDVCAATILPEWDATSVQINDAVRPL